MEHKVNTEAVELVKDTYSLACAMFQDHNTHVTL